VEIGTFGGIGVSAGTRPKLIRAPLFVVGVVKRLVGDWLAFGRVLEWSGAYDESERLTTNSRSFIIVSGC
jgi:hypothetical protein